jgi:glycine/D-amino acid oxidase-like deaminating enzyme
LVRHPEVAHDDVVAVHRELGERVARLAGRGYAAAFMSRVDALAREPGLAIPDRVREVAFFADEAWLDVARSIDAQLRAATTKGAEVRANTPLRSFRAKGGRVEALVIDGAEIDAAATLVCVGPSTQAFLEPLGVTMPVGRVPGLLTVTSRPAQSLTRVVHAPGVHLRPDASGGLLLGADDIDAPAAAASSDAEIAKLADELIARAGVVFPAARAVSRVDHRIGVRPMPADRHTIAGRIPGFENGWVIATHSGVTLGPLLGRLIADEIVRGTPSAALAPFRPDRFPR